MIEIIFLVSLALIWIIFATIQDLRTREVANWLNFSLIIFAIGFRFFFGLFSNNGFGLFYQGLIGLGIFFVLGNFFYYSRMFAGGDAKLMIALGAILPMSESFILNLNYFLNFFILFLIFGAFYGLVWSVVLMFRNFKEFRKEFPKQFRQVKIILYFMLVFGIVLLLLAFLFGLMFLYLSLFCFIFPLLFVYSRTIDEACMVKEVGVSKLREGDWLYKNTKVGNKIIKATWDGLNEKEIRLIKKKLNKIKIKQGIPFVPVFLISFVLFVYGILLGSQAISFLF